MDLEDYMYRNGMSNQELALVRVHIGTMHIDIGVNTNSDVSDEDIKKQALKRAEKDMPLGLYAIRAIVLSRESV
jgi:ribosomal protein L16/L10AE